MVKPGGRFRVIVTLLSIVAATAVVGVLIYQTTFNTLRSSYQQLLDRSVAQGVFQLESYLHNQFTLLSLYASVPSVQQGRFSDLPAWLTNPETTETSPKRLAIIDAAGRGMATTGQKFVVPDREYFRKARDGKRNVAGPVISRIDDIAIVVVAEPVPGNHPEAAVLTASIGLEVFRTLLNSIHGLSGAELTLRTVGGEVLATTAGPEPLAGNGLLDSHASLKVVPWILEAKVRANDLMQPVRTVLLVVGVLVIAGMGLILVFFLTGLRHRRDLDTVREDRTQALRDAYEQIRKLAYHDPVTRLPNRLLMVRKMGEALQSRTDLKVVVVAVARFRNLTTTFGITFGDEVLKETAARLAAFVPHDGKGFLGRLGGHEFVLLLETSSSPPNLLNSLLDSLRLPMGREDLRLHVNVHIGACGLLEGGATAEEIIKSAETALWAAREKGPHAASELTPAAVNRRLRRAQLQKLLPTALTEGQLEVHFQDQIDLKTSKTVGYEALLRWTSPDLGQVGPAEFVPVAEESGFIVPLGFWVLDRGIEFALALRERGTPAVVSVNVSAVQFLHHGFLAEVSRRIEAAGLPPDSLGLEITEGTLLEGIDQLRPALEKIMASGVRVSLDDFGTGFSSLTYLKDLPLHELKIDKTFVDALTTDDRARHLITCIIDLAHHLGLVVIAEGIETLEQQRLLEQVGCDLIQGFYTGRPRSSEAHLVRQTS